MEASTTARYSSSSFDGVEEDTLEAVEGVGFAKLVGQGAAQ